MEAAERDLGFRIATEIDRRSKRFYILGYCSPKRAGQHSLTLRLDGWEGSLSLEFDARAGPGGAAAEHLHEGVVDDQVLDWAA